MKTFSKWPSLVVNHRKLTEEAKANRRMMRFWAKVKFAGPRECWEWIGCKDRNGYGVFGNSRAHRFSWTHRRGKIPARFFVLHNCDNPACVNPAHLFLGTQKDNVEDCVKKGRHCYGEQHPASKLTSAIVAEARKLYSIHRWRVSALARKFGVTYMAMAFAVKGRTWKAVV